MILRGKAHKFGDDINTDYIISGRYKFKTLDMDELAKHVMEDIDPEFYSRLKPGDFLVAGNNFGCGSSREQAPLALKHAGVAGVIAKSFARIYFRNSINNGLLALICDTDEIHDGDILEVDPTSGTVKDITRGIELKSREIPPIMMEILNEGGLVPYMKKNKGFRSSKGCIFQK